MSFLKSLINSTNKIMFTLSLNCIMIQISIKYIAGLLITFSLIYGEILVVSQL